MNAPDEKILRMRDACALLGLKRSSLYEKLNPKSPRHDPTFPKPIHLGVRAIGFRRTRLLAWISSREQGAV